MAALQRSPTVAGRIINISEGGLSFRYVASQERSEESSHVNLLADNARSHFKTLPFKSIWDCAIPDAFSHGSISIRQCGIAFRDLMEGEQHDLKAFIRDHTTPNGENSPSVHGTGTYVASVEK